MPSMERLDVSTLPNSLQSRCLCVIAGWNKVSAYGAC